MGTRTEIRRRGGVIPSWVVFGMIILATLCLCVSVTKRTHAEMRAASDQYSKMSAEVEALRRSNRDLAVQVRRMKSDPVAIEAAARERLNMVRSNELVVPIE